MKDNECETYFNQVACQHGTDKQMSVQNKKQPKPPCKLACFITKIKSMVIKLKTTTTTNIQQPNTGSSNRHLGKPTRNCPPKYNVPSPLSDLETWIVPFLVLLDYLPHLSVDWKITGWDIFVSKPIFFPSDIQADGFFDQPVERFKRTSMKEISKVRPVQDRQGLCSKTNNDLVCFEPHTKKTRKKW